MTVIVNYNFWLTFLHKEFIEIHALNIRVFQSLHMQAWEIHCRLGSVLLTLVQERVTRVYRTTTRYHELGQVNLFRKKLLSDSPEMSVENPTLGKGDHTIILV